MTQALGVPFSSERWWDMNFLPNTVIVLVNLALFFFVYESPQFMIESKQNYEKVDIFLKEKLFGSRLDKLFRLTTVYQKMIHQSRPSSKYVTKLFRRNWRRRS